MWAMSEQIDLVLRACIPYMVMFVFFILNMITFSTPIFIVVEVPFIVMIIYYWSIYRPTILPPLLIFVSAICFDFISGLPVGLSAFTFLIMNNLVSQQRLFLTGQSFMVVWLGFVIVVFITLFIQWFLYGLINFSWTSLRAVMLSVISGVLLFPVVSFILNLSHKVLPILPDQYSAVK